MIIEGGFWNCSGYTSQLQVMNIYVIYSGIKLKRIILLTFLIYKIRTCLGLSKFSYDFNLFILCCKTIKQEKRKVDTVFDDYFAIGGAFFFYP